MMPARPAPATLTCPQGAGTGTTRGAGGAGHLSDVANDQGVPRWRRKAAPLAVACALAAPTAVVPAAAAPAPEVLLFTSNGVLETLRLDGSAERERLGTVGYGAVMSPDGRHVAGVTDDGVRVMRIDTGALVAIVPSGNSVAFAGNRHLAVGYTGDTEDGHACDTEGALFVVDLAVPVPRPLTVAAKPLVVLAASPGSAIVSVPAPDCSDSHLERVALDTGARTPMPGLWTAYGVDPATGDGWYHERASRGFPYGRGVVLSATNKVLGRTSTYIGSAAYGPGSAVVYSEPIRANDATLITDVILRLGKGIPRTGDRRTRFDSDGDFAWSTTGTAFALRREHRSGAFQAAVCTTSNLRCRPMPLRWHDEVDLLGIVPATDRG